MEIKKPEEILEEIIIFLSNKSLIPIIGSGLSVGLPTAAGRVPDGNDYRKHMLDQLVNCDKLSKDDKSDLESERFSKLCDYYEDDELVDALVRKRYLENNFYKVSFPENDLRKSFFSIEWPYIYSLNIDDAVEGNCQYTGKILPFRNVNEDFYDREKCIIKLHGDIEELLKYNDSYKVFTTQEYAQSLINNEFLLNKLRNDYANQNILFIGCGLEDEIDLISLQKLPVNFKQKETMNKVFYFMKGEPSALKKSSLNRFGITDIVCFEEYEDMYCFLNKAWHQRQQLQTDDLFKHAITSLNELDASDKTENQRYFYNVDGLYDGDKQVLTFPYFFISRDIAGEIKKQLKNNKIHLFFGNHFSGESYLLADLVRKIRNKKVYYFDGKTRMSNNALSELICSKNIVALFDIGTLNRYQFEEILVRSKEIHENRNNFVIALRNNDSDTLGIVKWKLKEGKIEENDIIKYRLENKLNFTGKSSELKRINEKLPAVGLPPYIQRTSFLDHLLRAESIFGQRGRYVIKPIKMNTEKERILMIILGIKEKLYSLEVVSFNLENEVSEACKKYSPYIEQEDVDLFEKSNADLSSLKYVLNSKYWIQKQLGEYAKNKSNWKEIGAAFTYIVKKLLKFKDANRQKRRERTRDYILFDKLNELFFDEKSNNIWLILEIYKYLEQYLAEDYQFLHQYAKGCLIGAYTTTETDKKLVYLKEAETKSLLAEWIINKEIKIKHNDKLQISKAHIQYTIAVIRSEKCTLECYQVKKDLEKAILSIEKAWDSEYNMDEFGRIDRIPWKDVIVNFISYCIVNAETLKVEKKYKEILNAILKKRTSN